MRSVGSNRRVLEAPLPQNRGIGIFIVRALAKIAAENGIAAFVASVHAENQVMLHIFHEVAGTMETKLDANIHHLRFELAAVEMGQKMKNIRQAMGS